MAKTKGFSKGAHHLSIAIPSSRPSGMDRYEVEDAARTMKRHQEIKANPKLHRAAKAHLKREKALADRAIKEK